MNEWSFCLPLVCAALGWALHGLAIRLYLRRLPARREQLAGRLAAAAKALLPGPEALETLAANPAHFEKLRPLVEEQIDHFLRVKLKEAMPMVGMFVGDKTIAQLKTIFVAELEQLFPVVMKKYAAGIAGELDIKRLITEKLNAIPPGALVKQLEHASVGERRALCRLGAVTGFCTGLLALALAWLLQQQHP